MSLAAQLAETIDKALGQLRSGGIVAFPTDTLYALGADAQNDAAVARVFAVKQRLLSNPLPLFVADLDMAVTIGDVPPAARALAAEFWPGALTLVIPKHQEFRSLALAGGETVALRAPDHPVAVDLLRLLGHPITATSANLSGGENPNSADEVARQLGATVDFIIDGGVCPIGAASTIVDCTLAADIRILRQGAIAESAIRACLDRADLS
jgi:L-threonylcarbamoyladenylate synthase